MNSFSNFFTISPANGIQHSATVIFLHGLGDGGNGWFLGFKQFMASRLPHVKFLFPIAPIQPVTLNMGYPMPS
jgi:predicted esterase